MLCSLLPPTQRARPALCAARRGFAEWFEDKRPPPPPSSSPYDATSATQQRHRHHHHHHNSSSNEPERAFALHNDPFDESHLVIDKKAYGVPFRITDDEALERVCAHYGCCSSSSGGKSNSSPRATIHDQRGNSVSSMHFYNSSSSNSSSSSSSTRLRVRRVERFLMPFWLVETSAAGVFRANVLQREMAFVTQQHCNVWVTGPRYEFCYPFGEHLPSSQICAAYREPMQLVERCLCGTHVPAMLLSRFELKEELQRAGRSVTLVPFAMSTATAVAIVSRRFTRDHLLQRIDFELRKFHGNFLRSSVHVSALHLSALRIRPVFLPLFKLHVAYTTSSAATVDGGNTTAVTIAGDNSNNSSSASVTATPSWQANDVDEVALPVPVFVCGATGRVVGPPLHIHRTTHLVVAATAATATATLLTNLSTLTAAMTTTAAAAATVVVVPPGLTFAAAMAAAACAPALLRRLVYRRQRQRYTRQLADACATAMLNHANDTGNGYRWCVEDEERDEYEYREELRTRARRKMVFEQRVKEEAARERAWQAAHEGGARIDYSGGSSNSNNNTYIHARLRRRGDLVHADTLGYYALLDLRGKEWTATTKDIAAAFRRAVQLYHPDVRHGDNNNNDSSSSSSSISGGGGSKSDDSGSKARDKVVDGDRDTPSDAATAHAAEQRKQHMQRIIAAYKVLRDPARRRDYDAGKMTADKAA